MLRKSSLIIVVLLMATAAAMADTIDLYTPTSPTFVTGTNGVIWQIISAAPTGTGNFHPFLKYQNQDTEVGFSTNADGFPNNHDSWTNSLKWGDLGAVTREVGGSEYITFTLDMDEPAGGKPNTRYLSIDQFTLLKGSIGDSTNPAALTIVYNVPDLILLNYGISGSGSGEGDIQVFIPVELLIGNVSANDFFYLYTKSGFAPRIPTNADPKDDFVFGSDDGPEEWKAYFGPSFIPPPSDIPEPASLLLLGTGLIGLGWLGRKFKK